MEIAGLKKYEIPLSNLAESKDYKCLKDVTESIVLSLLSHQMLTGEHNTHITKKTTSTSTHSIYFKLYDMHFNINLMSGTVLYLLKDNVSCPNGILVDTCISMEFVFIPLLD